MALRNLIKNPVGKKSVHQSDSNSVWHRFGRIWAFDIFSDELE